MFKVVINACYGGFGLSDEALDLYCSYKNIPESDELYYWDIERHDPDLIRVVEELGPKASTNFSKLVIEEVEEECYFISEYDGLESVVTPSSINWITPSRS